MEKVATRGRPREFDVEEALSAALRVFWTKGYESASLTDLTEAMGITRPSLYAAFGNKEDLFKSALDLYKREKLAYIDEAVSAPTAREAAANLLEGAIATITEGECRGCMGVIATVTCGTEDEAIRSHLDRIGRDSHNALIDRMQAGIDAGEFPAGADAEVTTQFLLTVLRGLSVQAQAGLSAAELRQVADATMAMWPSQ